MELLVTAADRVREPAGDKVNAAYECRGVVAGLVERVKLRVVRRVGIHVIGAAHEEMSSLGAVPVDTTSGVGIAERSRRERILALDRRKDRAGCGRGLLVLLH